MKFPNGNEYIPNSKTTYANRGSFFEEIINKTNEYYKSNNIALIYKKPTPIKVCKTKKIDGKLIINEAFFSSKSTTDYNGVYKSLHIDFDVKSTKNSKYFSLSNIKIHQLEHLYSVFNHGGISFILIYFEKYQSYYLLKINDFSYDYIKNRKVIKFDNINEICIKINLLNNGILDYLMYIN